MRQPLICQTRTGSAIKVIITQNMVYGEETMEGPASTLCILPHSSVFSVYYDFMSL